MLVSKNATICVTPNEIIGCVGSPTQNLCSGHVYFMLFVLISFALLTQREPSLQGNMGLRIDNSRQSVVCGILLSSLASVCTFTYYI